MLTSGELERYNRQILHWDEDIGRGKIDSAAEKLNGKHCGH